MHIFCTGATGMMGSEVVPKLLAAGHEVYALIRTKRDSWHHNLHFVPGDITKPIVYKGHATFDAVLHMAALTSLRESNEGFLTRVNYLGTQNIVEFCLSHHVRELFHISTLYVCGDHRGVWREEHYNEGQGFKNRYESSKYAAESLVRHHPLLRTTILRSGILVGRYQDGSSAFFEGFYRPVRAIVYAHRFAEQKLGLPPREELEHAMHLPRLSIPVRIWGQAESTLALTPVDWAADQVIKVVGKELGRESKTTPVYHVAPDRLPTMANITRGTNAGLGIGGWNAGPHTRNPLDLFYNRLIRDYLPYTKDQPDFETSLGHTCPVVDEEFIARCVRYWRTHGSREQAGVPVPGRGDYQRLEQTGGQGAI
ncbi:MAG: SDR family oxidoreductase [Dehalococcoidia bacterium]|nr:SDR family oxidoreductase [Dehalococcoidia bacterium]